MIQFNKGIEGLRLPPEYRLRLSSEVWDKRLGDWLGWTFFTSGQRCRSVSHASDH